MLLETPTLHPKPQMQAFCVSAPLVGNSPSLFGPSKLLAVVGGSEFKNGFGLFGFRVYATWQVVKDVFSSGSLIGYPERDHSFDNALRS